MMNRVSVIIPTWNRAETIRRAVQSVLDQTMSPFEVLVCDDGSTDDTFTKINEFKDPRVRWVTGERGGRPAIPRNRGIKVSTGEWLAFLDSDDEWEPDKLKKQLFALEQNGCLASCTNAFRLVPDQGIVGELLDWKKTRVSFHDLLRSNQVVCSSVIIHRSLIENINGFPEAEKMKAIEDYALWLRVATHTDFVFLNEPLVIYRDDTVNSIRGTSETDFWRQRRNVYNDFFGWAKHKHLSQKITLRALVQYHKDTIKRFLLKVLTRKRI